MKDSCNLPESDLPIRRRRPSRTCAGQSARDASAKTYVVEVAAILRNLLLLFREQSRFCVRRSIGITGNQGYGKNGPVHASLAHRFRSLRILTADVSAIIEKQEFYVSVVFNPSMIIRTPKKTNYPSQVRGRGTRTAAITTVTSRDTRIGADRPMIQEMNGSDEKGLVSDLHAEDHKERLHESRNPSALLTRTRLRGSNRREIRPACLRRSVAPESSREERISLG